MNEETQRKLLLIRIETLRKDLANRLGFDAYESFDMTEMSLSDLDMVRKAMHESLYAPPPRDRS